MTETNVARGRWHVLRCTVRCARNGSTRAAVWLGRLLLCTASLHPTTAAAQPPAPPVAGPPASAPTHTRFALGAMIGAALNADDANVAKNDVGPDLVVNADLGLGPATRVRAEFGRVRYTYDRNGARPVPMPAEQVTITRYTLGLLRKLDMAGANAFLVLGGGLYRYGAELTPLPQPTRPGVHLTFGTAAERKGLGLRFEVSARGIGGPQPRPVDGNPVPLPGRQFANVLVIFGASVGIGWHF